MTTFDFISILWMLFCCWAYMEQLHRSTTSEDLKCLCTPSFVSRIDPYLLSLTAGSTVWYLHPFGLLFGLPFYIGWHLHKVGGGDVKLAAVLGLYFGLPACVILVIFMLPILFAYYLFLHTSKASVAMAPIFSLAAIAMLVIQYLIF